MTAAPARILVLHTAFVGDVILLLPLIQVLRERFDTAIIDVVTIPAAAAVLANHPAINRVIAYDKRGSQKGVQNIFKFAQALRGDGYDTMVMPHRSLRSAAVGWVARIPRRIGFNRSAGWFLLTDVVHYEKNAHEIQRNLSLAKPLGVTWSGMPLPMLYPSTDDRKVVDHLMVQLPATDGREKIALAPGSVWNTKRWLKERYLELGKMLLAEGFSIVLIGGNEDRSLCSEIETALPDTHLLNAAGKLSLLQSAEVIGRCRVAVTNDSAPMHLAVAMRTPVVAVFGATVPEYGFAPLGELDTVVETRGLSCRPCAIHGGNICPMKTFDCMTRIGANAVMEKVLNIVHHLRAEA